MIYGFPALAGLVYLFSVQAELYLVLDNVAERIEEYYRTLINVVTLEKVTQQRLGDKLQAIDNPREFVYDLTMTREAVAGQSAPLIRVHRKAPSAAGTARPDDARPCTDPAESYTEPLAFLRAGRRSE